MAPIFGDYTMIGAVGVDVEGNKHVLSIREGATENSTVITELLEDVVALPGGHQHHRKPACRVRIQTKRVTHWKNGKMVLRWMASAFIRTQKRFNKIMGHGDLWTLDAILNPTATARQKAA